MAEGGGMGAPPAKQRDIVVKVGLIGDVETGKTSIMVKYVEGIFDQDYIETLGVNFMEKTISLKNVNVTFTLWDLGGAKDYHDLLPLVCEEARVLLFVFDLMKKSSLIAVKNWYKLARQENKHAVAFLIGSKYDKFMELDSSQKRETTKHARKFAKAMKAPLIFCSARSAINVNKIFQIIVSKVFNVEPRVKELTADGEPIIEYKKQGNGKQKKKKKKKKDKTGKEEEDEEEIAAQQE